MASLYAVTVAKELEQKHFANEKKGRRSSAWICNKTNSYI